MRFRFSRTWFFNLCLFITITISRNIITKNHKSSEEEVDVMIENMKVFLRKTNRPSIITTARFMGEEKDSVDSISPFYS